MPREFYSDTELENTSPENDQAEQFCLNQINFWDGPASCMRGAGHKVDVMTKENMKTGEFHQEAFEGWVWDDNGSIG